jgi:glycolate oxidase iron-sulfur subunit
LSKLSDLAAQCIRCGFCLEACPTYLETGMETESPRGRIYLVRSAEEGTLQYSHAAVGRHLDLCVGCRACEPACPSGVEYGAILELARQRLSGRGGSWLKRRFVDAVSSPSLLKAQLLLGGVLPGRRIPTLLSRLLSGKRPEAEKPRAQRAFDWPKLADAEVPPVKGEVYLLEGCAMRVLYPRVHEATRRLLRRVGFAVRGSRAGCCGALHAHQGCLDRARKLARSLEDVMPDDLPIIVNSAGCGSFLKDHGDALATRTKDVSEFLLEQGLSKALQDLRAPHMLQVLQNPLRATYHEACHLAHGQRIREQPRELLRATPGLKLVELAEADLCCGSGGVYNVFQPEMARRLLDRKWRNVEDTGATLLVTGNPGCQSWLEQASREHGCRVRVMHTAEVLENALSGVLSQVLAGPDARSNKR